MCPLPTHPYAQPPSEPLALVFLIHTVVVLALTNPAPTRSLGRGQPLAQCSGECRLFSTLSMMSHVFYTRQAYVRIFMKDILDYPDPQLNHRPRRFANELRTELSQSSFHPRPNRTPMYRHFNNKSFLLAPRNPHITQGIGGK